jgi:hypothetical protein
MELQEAFKQMQGDQELAKKVTEDPEATLKSLGVDTSGLHIQEIPGGNAPFEAFSSVSPEITACVSVGCVVCASIG